jgi:signal transduction histidine kinase/FixJ family two-component response regulator
MGLTDALTDILEDRKESNIICVSSDDPAMKKIMAPYRINFQSFLTTFILVDDQFYAALDFSRADDQQWSGNEKDLAILFSNILTGAFQRRAVSAQLITAKEKAEESNRSKSIFLANMSHEIRTPMNSILGMAEIQLQENELPPNVEEAFNIIYDSGNLLINIINDILDFSKIEAGKLELNPVSYDIPSLLHDTVQLMRLRYESKPLDFHLDINENTPVMWFGDELRIKQVFNNILSNAFKYTDAGTIALSVFADDIRKDEAVLTFRVSDTGRGMSEEELNQLFDEYARFNEKDNRTTGGTGLGMSITKRILDLMAGQITVESEPGKGSVFTVRIPQKFSGSLVCGPEVSNSFSKNSRGLSAKSRIAQFKRENMSDGKVLIVDDVETNLYVAKGLLIPYGLTIEAVTSGFAAIELIKQGNVYDIIFMDHMMPQMDGMEAAKIIRGLGYGHPIVALTANVIAGQAEIFMANGFDEFISKPIDIRELDAVLNAFIKERPLPDRKKGRPVREDDKLKQAFIRDAGKTVAVLKDIYARLDTYDEEDMKMYVTSIHGLKSVLGVVGETALADFANELEQAGRNRDTAFFLFFTPVLLGKIEGILLE